MVLFHIFVSIFCHICQWNKKNVSSQLEGVSEAISQMAEDIKQEKEEPFETQKQEITLKGLIDIEWKITMLLRSKFPKLVDVI